MKWITEKRLRVYPRIILATEWLIIAFNFVFHNGWQGAIGQIIGVDYLALFSGALLYRRDIHKLYDFAAQFEIQKALIYPTTLPGVMPFYYPPYVALAYVPLTKIGYPASLFLWLVLSFVCIYPASRWLEASLPVKLRSESLNWKYIGIVLLSFFPFVLGWQVGQNHAITLLLTSGIIYFSLQKRYVAAGALAGLLVYKPQFVLGFLIVWLMWRQWKSLIAFGVAAGIWSVIPLLQHGLQPYLDLLRISWLPMVLPYMEGWPTYLMVTPYGLLTTLLPQSAQSILTKANLILMAAFGLGLAWVAFRLRDQALLKKLPALGLCLLFPLIATPYTLVHDLVILIPFFVLWAYQDPGKPALYAAIATYFSSLLLPTISYAVGLALLAIIPLGLTIGYLCTQKDNLLRSKQILE